MPVEKLSGGQKARLLMLIATIDAPHILILDEPTNHLDIESREALVLALNEYEGAVILVSHDTHLVESVADRLWLVSEGAVSSFDGDMDDYKKLIMQNAKTQRPAKEKKTQAKSKTDAPRKVNPVKLKSQARDLEVTIDKLTAKKERLEKDMAAPDFYSKNGGETIAAITTKLADVVETLARTEEQWLEVLAALDEA
jgi:ATP-binding cassette subfamily F protein 3